MGNYSAKTTKEEEEDVKCDVPSPPQLSVLKTVTKKEDETNLGTLGAELVREFSKKDGPSYWATMKGNSTLITVRKGSKEYAEALRHFQKSDKTHKIVKIERVQNIFLWRRYLSRKIAMIAKNKGVINERALFHGTRATPSSKICDGSNASGFDPRLGSAGFYGTGVYFSVDAAYSTSDYSYSCGNGMRQIFLAKVLTGITKDYGTTYMRQLKRAPNLPGSADLYDSVSGGPHGTRVKSRMFVVYDATQAYPMYLYTYKG
eukprot:g3201.t1